MCHWVLVGNRSYNLLIKHWPIGWRLFRWSLKTVFVSFYLITKAIVIFFPAALSAPSDLVWVILRIPEVRSWFHEKLWRWSWWHFFSSATSHHHKSMIWGNFFDRHAWSELYLFNIGCGWNMWYWISDIFPPEKEIWGIIIIVITIIIIILWYYD